LLEKVMSTEQKISRPELTDEERAAQLYALLNSEPPPMIQKSIHTFRRSRSLITPPPLTSAVNLFALSVTRLLSG
jgi:hypothetical protein